MSPTRLFWLAATALLLVIPAAAMAEVYKWVDDDGVTHYSQQPPPEGTPTVLTPNPGTPASPEDGETEADNGGTDDEEANGEPGTIAEFCKELRDREKVLEGDRPIRVKAEDGTLTDLDDEGRAQRLERVQGQLRDHCQGADAQSG